AGAEGQTPMPGPPRPQGGRRRAARDGRRPRVRSPSCTRGRTGAPRSRPRRGRQEAPGATLQQPGSRSPADHLAGPAGPIRPSCPPRSEEHTSELQSRENLVCRLLLEKKKLIIIIILIYTH